jgi:propanol-preferring alcohol dehydrogenase
MATEIPDTMRAAQLEEFGRPYVVRRVPTPRVADPRDVLIKTTAASWCLTDGEVARGVPVHGGCVLPIIPGHEGVGMVAELGDAVKDSFTIGQHVGTLNAYHPCGTICSTIKLLTN